ncbi:hypothetical protein [Flavobacterium humi]|uniref:Lipoprotein n=1 Tax=Flavobacterium humi TaxID=2562683 RepID=A0A4Z0LDG1_9FLAO|nr:hypothetical protein [Flavobacterium humi]TGD59893.1 hypothetical protein E4635_02885 [Flavobacterium humi]
MRKSIILFMLTVLTIFTSCSKKQNYIYSLDRKQCITIITEGKVRYIIDGKHSKVPHNNYLKLDLNKIDSFGDEIVGCWKEGKYEWFVINDGARIIEFKLDSTKFKFKTDFPLDERGISSLKNFKKEKCFDLGIENGEINLIRGDVIVE